MRRAAALVAAAALTVLFWPALRGAEILGFRDMLHNYTPMMALFWRGQSWLWNDHAFGGSSILADLVQQPFYLPNLLFRVVGAPAWPGIAVYLWLHALLGLWAAYALARRYSPAGAGVAAAAFALCGFSLANASDMQFPCAAAWAPAVLLAADAWGSSNGRRHAALFALALPQPLLAGDPLLCALLGLAGFLLAARRRFRFGEQRSPALSEQVNSVHQKFFWREAVWIAAAAIFLASPQLVATLRALPLMTRGAGFSLAEREQWSLHPARIVELFVPRLFGPLFSDGFWGAFTTAPPWKRNYVHSIYAGVAGPALVLLALRERAARPWLWLCGATLALALGSHFFHLFGLVTSLPILRAFRYPERLFALFVPAWAMLLAIGTARLFELRPGRRALLLGGSALLALMALFLTARLAPSADRASVIRSALQIGTAGAACAVAVLLPRGAELGLTAVLVVDLCAANADLLGLLPRAPFRDEPAACAALDRASDGAPRNSFRVYVDQEHLEKPAADWSGQREREYQFGKRNLLEQCGFRESAALTSFEPRAERELWLGAGPLRELRALGTRFVVGVPGSAAMFGARERLVDERWQFAIDEIAGAPPLFFRPQAVEQIEPDRLVAAAARRPELLGSDIAALESPPREHAPDPAARLSEVHDEPARISFRVEQQNPGYWVLAATLDRDWRAEIDGEPATIERCDGVRRAIWLPPGEHRVTLWYRPALLLALFGFSLALCAALAVQASRRTPGAAI